MLRDFRTFYQRYQKAYFVQCSPRFCFPSENGSFLRRFSGLAFGNRSYIGLNDFTAADNNRCLCVHICNDMSKCAIYSLIRSVEGQRPNASCRITNIKSKPPSFILLVIGRSQGRSSFLTYVYNATSSGFFTSPCYFNDLSHTFTSIQTIPSIWVIRSPNLMPAISPGDTRSS